LICIKRSFMICTGHEIYLADDIKRDEGSGLVESMGEERDCTFNFVDT